MCWPAGLTSRVIYPACSRDCSRLDAVWVLEKMWFANSDDDILVIPSSPPMSASFFSADMSSIVLAIFEMHIKYGVHNLKGYGKIPGTF